MNFEVNVIYPNFSEDQWFADSFEEICKDLKNSYTEEELKTIYKIEIFPLTDEE